MSLIGLLITLVVVLVIFWAVNTLMATFEVPPQIAKTVYVLFVVIVVLWLASALFGVGGSLGTLRIGR